MNKITKYKIITSSINILCGCLVLPFAVIGCMLEYLTAPFEWILNRHHNMMLSFKSKMLKKYDLDLYMQGNKTVILPKENNN